MASTSGSSMDFRSKVEDKERDYYLEREKALVGGNFVTPDGDFSRFLGYTPPSEPEKAGATPVSGQRVVELALRENFQDLGNRAQRTGMSARNMYISHSSLQNEPGRDRDLVADIHDAVKQGPENRSDDLGSYKKNLGLSGDGTTEQYFKVLNEYHAKSREDNYRYMEMQYKFLFASKSFGTVSNLMKVRYEAVRQSMRDAR